MIKNPHQFINQDFKKYCKSLTCLNGKLPKTDFFKKNKLPIIAADGGLEQLIKKSIIPDLVIGDMDTAKEENLTKTKFIKIIDDDTFDFEKTLTYLKENNLLPTLVLGMNGGYLDQIFNNLNIALQQNVIFYDAPILGIPVRCKHSFNLPLHTKISFIGNGIVSTTGLKWNLNNSTIQFPGSLSVSNRTINETMTINVIQGAIFTLIYCLNPKDIM